MVMTHTLKSTSPVLSLLPAFSGIIKDIVMDQSEKEMLVRELQDSFYRFNGSNSTGEWISEIRVDPEKLQKLLQYLIEAL